MAFNYKKIGSLISEVDVRNSKSSVDNLIGVTIDKVFIPSVANTNGTDLSKYKIIHKNQFACSLMQVSRDGGVAISMYKSDTPSIMSPAYFIFEVNTPDVLPEYLELVLYNPEFDREATFNAVGGVRGTLTWEDFCNLEIHIPTVAEQEKIVNQYNAIINRIDVLDRLNGKLLELEKILYWNFLSENSSKQEVKNINELFEIKYGKGLPTEKLMDNGFWVYGGNGIIGKYSKCLYEKPQILVSCRGASSGAVLISLENIFVTSNSLVMELKDYDLFDFYRLYFLDNPLYEYVTGSAQPQLTIDSLDKCQVPVFDKSDLLPLTSKLHSIWKLKNCNTIEIMKLNEFRQTFLKNI